MPFFDNLLQWWLKNNYNDEILILFKLFLVLTFLGCLSHIIISLYEANLVEDKYKARVIQYSAIFNWFVYMFLFKKYNLFCFIIAVKRNNFAFNKNFLYEILS